MRRHRLVKAVTFLLLLVALIYVGLWAWLLSRQAEGRRRYADAVAELDRAEPDWRAPGPLAGQAVAPEAAETARTIGRVSQSLPPQLWLAATPWEPAPVIPAQVLPEALLDEARRLGDLPDGQFPILPDGADWMPGGPTRHEQAVLRVARLLHADGMDRARSGDWEGASRAVSAVAAVGRSLARDPRYSSVRARLECHDLTVDLVGLLARCPIPEPALECCAAVLREEPPAALAEFARGERALVHACLEEARAGLLRHPDLPAPLTEEAMHARALRALTASVAFAEEVGGEPLEAARARLVALAGVFRAEGAAAEGEGGSARAWSYLKSRHLTVLSDVVELTAACNERVRCARVGLAAERFRLRRGRWPAGAEDLVPGFLPSWPADTEAGLPLVCERRGPGLVIRPRRVALPPQAAEGVPAMWGQPGVEFELPDPGPRIPESLKRGGQPGGGGVRPGR